VKTKSIKVVIIPDVHGRPFWREVLTNKEDTIVFLGDYSDPYEYEGFTHKDAVRELTDIVQFKKDNPERVILLLGNHDAPYIHPNFPTCRYSNELKNEYRKLFTDEPDLFQIAYNLRLNDIDYLFTHAGVNNEWFEMMSPNFVNTNHDIAAELNRAWKETPEIFATVGRARGGNKTPSPIWADYEEHDAFYGYPDSIQIFGHTQQRKNPILVGSMWCLDCRKVFVLEEDTISYYTELGDKMELSFGKDI
jgi:predicted MPP superfamily phosphohydrolase